MNTVISNKKLTEKEKIDLLREILGEKYSAVGNNLPLLKNAIDIIGHIVLVKSYRTLFSENFHS